MQKFRTLIIFPILSLLIIGIPGQFNSRAYAQDAKPTIPAPPYQEPVPVKREIEYSGLRRVVGAPSTSSVLTNVLPSGDSSIHGLIFHNGYLWASTRTAPGSVLKINPSTLAVDLRATFLPGRNNAEDIVAANGYIWSITSTDPAWLVRVDPATMAIQYTSLSSGGSNFLAYAESLAFSFGKLWVGGYDKIAEVDISVPASPTFVLHDYSSLIDQDYVLATAMASDSNYLWAVFTQGDFTPPSLVGTTFARINPATPTSGYITTTLTSILFPDDMFRENGFLYTSSENSGLPSNAYKFPTSMVPYTTSMASATGISYGVFFNPLDPGTYWGAYTGSPGVLLKFDLNLNKIFTITLPSTPVSFDDPSEIAFDPNGNMYVSTFQDPAGIIKYTVPSSVTLSISKSGSDAVLGWTNSDALVDHYEVWRSTSPYFQPGDLGSSKLADVTATVGSLGYTDTGALGDINNNYYYVVRAFNDFGLFGPISNRVGEFAIPILPNWNLIAWPIIPVDVTLDDVIGSQLFGTEDPTTADRILVWDDVLQSYESAWFCSGSICQSWGQPYYNHWLATDYSQSTLSLPPDEGFWIQNRSGITETLVLVGNVSETSRTVSVGTNWQMLGRTFPTAKNLDLSNITATGTEDPQTADRILYWNSTTQSYKSAWLCGGVICQSWGQPYYNHWLALDYSLSDIILLPGHGFWLQNRHTPFFWVNPP